MTRIYMVTPLGGCVQGIDAAESQIMFKEYVVCLTKCPCCGIPVELTLKREGNALHDDEGQLPRFRLFSAKDMSTGLSVSYDFQE